MKRLLLVSVVGLSLVGCSNEVDYSQTEIPVQDTKPTLEEQRLELSRRTKEENLNKSPERKEAERKVSDNIVKYGSPETYIVFDDGSSLYIWGEYMCDSVLVPAK